MIVCGRYHNDLVDGDALAPNHGEHLQSHHEQQRTCTTSCGMNAQKADRAGQKLPRLDNDEICCW